MVDVPTGETKTTIDSLMDLLIKKGRMDSSSIALALGVDPNIVESWSKVLEGGGLVKITYEMGKMYVEPLNLSKEEQEVLQKKIENEIEIVQQDLASQSINLDQFTEALKNINVNISQLQELYRSSLPGIEELLSQINKFNSIASESSRHFEDLQKKAESTYTEISKQADELIKKINLLSSTAFDRSIEENHAKIGNLLKEVDEGSAAIKAIEESTAEAFKVLVKNIDTQAEEIRKQAIEKNEMVLRQLKQGYVELESIAKAMKGKSEEIKDLENSLKEFKAHREGALRTLEMEKTQITDAYSKIHTTLESNKVQVDRVTKELIEKISALKSSFGEVSSIDDKIREVSKEVGDIGKQVEETKKEVSELSAQLAALKKSNASLLEKSRMIGELSAESKRTEKKAKNIREKLGKVSKKFSK